jgi:hypothetical protein
MPVKRWLIIAMAATLLLAACTGADGPAGPAGPAGADGEAAAGVFAAEYVGMATCAGCHSEIAEKVALSGHPFKLNKVVDGQPPEYPFTEVVDVPDGYTRDDITYVIGGYNWKARFIGQDGFIITGDADSATQYNFVNEDIGLGGDWVPYHPGEEKPYNCGPCHFEKAEEQKSQIMSQFLDCIDCHMPRLVKSAVGDAAAFTGDIRTHMWAIDPNAVSQFTEDGSGAISQISLDFACKWCHRDGGTASVRTDQELIDEANGYHSP